MSNKRKRRTYEQQSIFAWMRKDETSSQARIRLDAEWKAGIHPTQKIKEEKNDNVL